MTDSRLSTCPNCAAAATGKFCAECGASLRPAACASCAAPLTPGARFCHRCGTAAGGVDGAASSTAGAPGGSSALAREISRGGASVVPWSIAALAFLAVVAILAGQRYGESRRQPSSDAAATSDTRTPLGAGSAPGAAPDISSLSPRERADRLYDRMMRLASENKRDSISFFAPMALAAYESLGPLDNDLRFDLGRVAELGGNLDVAGAQADSILLQSPTHLLGLLLAERVAQRRGDLRARDDYQKRLIAAEAAEKKKDLEEYTRHKGDIDTALSEARGRR